MSMLTLLTLGLKMETKGKTADICMHLASPEIKIKREKSKYVREE